MRPENEMACAGHEPPDRGGMMLGVVVVGMLLAAVLAPVTVALAMWGGWLCWCGG